MFCSLAMSRILTALQSIFGCKKHFDIICKHVAIKFRIEHSTMCLKYSSSGYNAGRD